MDDKFRVTRIKTETLDLVKEMAREVGVSVPTMLDAAVSAIWLLKNLGKVTIQTGDQAPSITITQPK
jgi:hypothetical protein